ncbi:MAG: type II secretion system minor pseudopilin GspK [Porticoccaceae bacterium]|nr:type II secretion system minor pseudopilin GspK [Porticoccaceae bacterium]
MKSKRPVLHCTQLLTGSYPLGAFQSLRASHQLMASPRRQQSGVALLATLILILALTLILGNIFYRHQIDVSQATGSLHGDQAVLLAISGENWARDLLSVANDDTTTDHFDEVWAQAIPLMPVSGGLLTGCLVDLSSLINLNNFSGYTAASLKRERESSAVGLVKVWETLLRERDFLVDQKRVPVIIDWLDSGDSLISPAGAEQADYSSFDPPRFPANMAIADTAELAAIDGYSLAEVQRLMPWISALPEQTKINVNTAPVAVLMALSDGMGRDFVDLVLDGRPFLTLQDFYKAIDIHLRVGEAVLAVRWPESLVDVKSDFFQLNLDVTLGQSKLEVKSIMHRKPFGPPAVIRREITVVPAGVATVPSDNPDSDEEFAEDLASSGDERFSGTDKAGEDDQEYYLRPICEITDSYFNRSTALGSTNGINSGNGNN